MSYVSGIEMFTVTASICAMRSRSSQACLIDTRHATRMQHIRGSCWLHCFSAINVHADSLLDEIILPELFVLRCLLPLSSRIPGQRVGDAVLRTAGNPSPQSKDAAAHQDSWCVMQQSNHLVVSRQASVPLTDEASGRLVSRSILAKAPPPKKKGAYPQDLQNLHLSARTC